ncbi:AAA domain containing protein [uncultured Caudovirales phage]|uniref:AAA domain containing protein n=1 Tax=uncultured Caudovirales phage TaxID=2100421 RepID=A0A6J5KMI2_9CAUD|nr:AAA domain containing protein [uncultured Caudovirales phage]
MNVTLSQASTLIRTVGQTNTVLLRGQPGIGKSSILHGIKEFFPNHFLSYIDAANLDLGDIAMPVVDREELVTEYAPNARFGVGRNQARPVVMMIDELGKASRPVMNMLLPVILERRIGDLQLPEGSIIFATTNLDTDGVGDNIPAHAYNRMTVCNVANPTSDEWLQWAGNNGVAPEVMAFAKQTPEIFDCYVDLEKGAKNPYIFNPMAGVVRGFCSPRSLAKASHIIAQRAALGSAVLPALAGTIGEPAARQMEALINLADQLPLFEQIVKDPAKIKVPKGAGALFLLAFMLAGRVTADSMDAVMEYGERISTESFEAHSLLIMTLASNKTKVGMACGNRAFTTAASKLGKFF